MFMKIGREMALSILLTISVLLPVIGASNDTLTSKEDLSNIEFDLNAEEKNIDKNKRELPKVQSVIINILKPVPVVDTIKEEEKYGNTGDKFNRLGRGVVNGVETVANLVNSALNFPMEAVKKLSRSATEALNNLGGKLVGLQR